MTGMGEMPDERPLMLCGCPGEGVSAGDEGRLLYTQHAGGAEEEEEEHKTLFIQKKKSKK